jgi:hypothetical protein
MEVEGNDRQLCIRTEILKQFTLNVTAHHEMAEQRNAVVCPIYLDLSPKRSGVGGS